MTGQARHFEPLEPEVVEFWRRRIAEDRQLVEWVQRHPGTTAREVARHLRRYHRAGGTRDAEADLKSLVAVGRLEETPTRVGPRCVGRPTVVYRVPDDDRP